VPCVGAHPFSSLRGHRIASSIPVQHGQRLCDKGFSA
jgi:hypothetical protein